MNSTYLDIHADDYGLSENSDKDIIELCKNGKLDSISIIPNLEFFSKSVEKFNKYKSQFPKEINVSVHINIMEGRCCATKEELPDLVDANGFFTVSWGTLFLWNYIPQKRNCIKQQLKKEIYAQILRCINAGIVDENKLRIDSHQHPHMIPVFFDAIIELIQEKNLKIEYIRNTKDPIRFYKRNFFMEISFANIIKCMILSIFSLHSQRILKRQGFPLSYLCGVFYSGKMDVRVKNIIPIFISKSKKNNYITELLFHPGTMLSSELTEEFSKKGFNDFHLSENRKIEFEEVKSL